MSGTLQCRAMKRSLLILLLALPLSAQTATQTIVLRAARMFDGTTDSVTSPGVVVVSGNRISGVGPAAVIPANARVIDLGDATLLPGLIDAHTHLSMEMGSSFIADFFTGAFRHSTEQAHY